ncbi:MAG: histidinol-phosphate transaminase [Clostridiales bacterium]|nr:histidinol-phosphate transaminase [Clostridiales bacterium]
MSRFFRSRYSNLIPYTPGEQPRNMEYIKLNTNESPFPPGESVVRAMEKAASRANLYNDPECTSLRRKAAELYGTGADNITCTNGSDEILYLAFSAFFDEAAFPDITYGFYKVYADVLGIKADIKPLREDFTIDVSDYTGIGKGIVIANPNAQTGIALPKSDIERIVASNPDSVVIVDEAYIDFGGESCVDLTEKYPNLLVTQTFSKSRSLAGARIGFGIGNEQLIADINTLRYSMNPYNVNTATQWAAEAAIEDNESYMANCAVIVENREYTSSRLRKLGFDVLPSSSNFIFAKSDRLDGGYIYEELKKKGVLVRHFTDERMKDHIRVTIGTREQMDIFIGKVEQLL